MAIIALADLKTHLGIGDTDDDTTLTTAVNAVNTAIPQVCRRSFDLESSASARVFYPIHSRYVVVDDIGDTTGLIIKTDEDDDGTFEKTIAATDYQLEPLNGVVDGVSGWPYTAIRAVESDTFPSGHRASVQVTAKWGWAAVPAPVKQAALLMGARLFRRKDSPEAQMGFGEFALRLARTDPDVTLLLAKYEKQPVLMA